MGPSGERFALSLRHRVALALLPWVLAGASVALTIDGFAFHNGSDAPPMLDPTAPAAPVEHAPAPKSQERTIDPSERIPV
ncbi:MAG TPA: hypothetical protein VNO21_13735 [Polyangiaceae bacterium]|nr:hypothetical protein [Polyangiaceae bacterium]